MRQMQLAARDAVAGCCGGKRKHGRANGGRSVALCWRLEQLLSQKRNMQMLDSLLTSNPRRDIMSLDQARVFIEKMKSDVAFKERILAIEDILSL
jgi:hypothetical protein